MIDRWSARPRDRRADFQGAADPTPSVDPCGLQLKENVWNIVPHGKNKQKLSGI